MKYFLSVLFCLSFCFCNAQNNFAQSLDSISGIKDRNLKIRLLENLKSTYKVDESALSARLHHTLGVEYHVTGDYPKAIESAQKSLVIKESIDGFEVESLHKTLNLLSQSYKKSGSIDKYNEFLYRLINANEQTRFSLSATLQLAQIQKSIGDYFKGIEYADRIIHSYEGHKNESYYIKAHLEVISIFAEMKPNDSSFLNKIEYHKEEIEKRIDELDTYDKIVFYNSQGIIYRGYQKRREALQAYQKNLEFITEEEAGIDESTINKIHLNIAEIYSQLEEPVKAKKYYKKILQTTDSINISAAYNNLGYYHTESVEEEIKLHQRAIQLLGIKSDFSESRPFLEEIKDSFLKEELLFALIDLSQAWIELYNENKDVKNLNEALRITNRIDDLISLMRLDSATKASKLFWIGRGVNSYFEAVKVCYLLNKPAEAFYFMEKNKSLYLLEQLGKLQLKNEYKIPSRLLEKEINLNYDILLAKNALNKDSKSTSFLDAYNEASQKHFKFTDSLKKAFPDYYKSSLKPKLISLNDFQKFLKEKNSQAVEYILGEKEGYGLWINDNEVHFFQLENYSKLIDNISFLKQVFTNPSLTKEEVSQYEKIGFETFKILFPFKEAREQIQTKQLKIIPSGILYNFQFESLIVDQKPMLKDNFLIHLAEVSYLNSASVSKNIYNSESVNSHSYLGVAPVNFASHELVNLKGSEHTIKEIASLFSSKVKLKEKATRKEFLNTSEEALIFHVNTHAGIDQKTKLPWLSMNDTLVSLEELYIKNRPHHLVFLDACKTADGKLQRGEGIESLSRAFFHSGSKSVIASQWNANEKATNKISLSFFKELKLGKTKSEALRQAKLNYLEESQLSTTFPYFWASLTLTGNSDALPEVPYRLDYWILVAFILLILFVFYRKKRSFKS